MSLSKTASYLSKFVESDCGASGANLGFLKRASAAFNELNAFNMKIVKAKFKLLGEWEDDDDDDDDDDDEKVKSGGVVALDDDVKKEHMKKEKKRKNDGVNGAAVVVDGRKGKKLEDGEDAKIDDTEKESLRKGER